MSDGNHSLEQTDRGAGERDRTETDTPWASGSNHKSTHELPLSWHLLTDRLNDLTPHKTQELAQTGQKAASPDPDWNKKHCICQIKTSLARDPQIEEECGVSDTEYPGV